jgi:hypothetical protein
MKLARSPARDELRAGVFSFDKQHENGKINKRRKRVGLQMDTGSNAHHTYPITSLTKSSSLDTY